MQHASGKNLLMNILSISLGLTVVTVLMLGAGYILDGLRGALIGMLCAMLMNLVAGYMHWRRLSQY